MSAAWAAPQPGEGAIADLRKAVKNEDWPLLHAKGKTKMEVSAEWSASAERANALVCLASLSGAKRVLEVGGFCGVATLSLAESLPPGGEIVTIELDPFLVEFAKRFFEKSESYSKIQSTMGDAKEHLEQLAASAKSGSLAPFDLVIVDADKANMSHYFNLLWKTPGMLSDRAIVCVDTMPFKGQPPKRYQRFGFEDKWEMNSGQADIDAFRKMVAGMEDVTGNEFAGIFVAQKKKKD